MIPAPTIWNKIPWTDIQGGIKDILPLVAIDLVVSRFLLLPRFVPQNQIEPSLKIEICGPLVDEVARRILLKAGESIIKDNCSCFPGPIRNHRQLIARAYANLPLAILQYNDTNGAAAGAYQVARAAVLGMQLSKISTERSLIGAIAAHAFHSLACAAFSLAVPINATTHPKMRHFWGPREARLTME